MNSHPTATHEMCSRRRKEALPTQSFSTSSRQRMPILATLLVLLSFVTFGALAQEGGIVSGVVVSTWDGTPLQGVTVTVRGTTLATQTDSNGRYDLKNVPSGDQVLRFSKPGFATAVVTDARVLIGQLTTVNGNLRPEFYEMEEYEVTAEEFTEQTEKILIERQQASSMMDAIGSDRFSKLGAGDAGAIMAKVTGVSVVGGKYVVVRGLSDRYTRTLLNGAEVPSADPYRMSPQLDLFPSAMIDRINVSKTFTPDQPGGTGGGTIDIVTKSFPEKPFVKGSFGNSYNENSNLKKNFLADPSSSMAIFAIPSGPKSLRPDLFGLTAAPDLPNNAGRNETAENAALRRQQANDVSELLHSLGTANFAGVSRSSPLNSSFNASAGDTVPVFDHNFGMFGGLNYSRNFKFIEDGIRNKYNYNGTAKLLGNESRGNIVTDYGANANLGYELWQNSHVGFNFMFARNVDEEARHGTFPTVEGREDVRSLEQWQLHYTDRKIMNYQFHGEHEFPVLADSKLNWVVSLANTTQHEPDQRFMNYFLDENGNGLFGDASTPFPQFPARYFREIEENSLNYRFDWTLPLAFMKEDSKLKAGYYSSSSDRDFREQYFAYDLSSGFDSRNPNTYLNDPRYLDYVANYVGNSRYGVGRTNFSFTRFVTDTFSHPYTASQNIDAGYLMADVGVLPWLRLIGGARLEGTLIKLDAGREGSAHIEQTDLLPAASAVITFHTNVNLRLSYGETVGRPSFRELAPVDGYLPDLGVIARGNPDLKMISIKSYDMRAEWYPAPGDILSAGVFYKEIVGPIELVSLDAADQLVTWVNAGGFTSQGLGAGKLIKASLMGAEFEARKSLGFITPLLNELTLGANVTLIQSDRKLSKIELDNKRSVDPFFPDSRALYDQSPYIINLDLNYDHAKSGTSFTIAANLTGARLALVKTLGPDIYEHPPITLDAMINQKFWKHWTFRFGVRNILDTRFLQTYGSSPEGKIFQAYHYGRTYGVALTAEF